MYVRIAQNAISTFGPADQNHPITYFEIFFMPFKCLKYSIPRRKCSLNYYYKFANFGHVNISEYHGHSGESFCSSDISLDGSNFDQIDEGTSDTLSLQNLDLQNHQPVQHGSLLHEPMSLASNSIINPIDKLYLMQNSYFNSEN